MSACRSSSHLELEVVGADGPFGRREMLSRSSVSLSTKSVTATSLAGQWG